MTQPTERTEQPRPQVQAVQKAPERKRIEAPTDKKAAQKKQRAAATPTDAASGIGRGRSDNSANYAGMVARAPCSLQANPAAARAAGSTGRRDRIVLARRRRPRDLGAAGGQFRQCRPSTRRSWPWCAGPRRSRAPPDGQGRNFTGFRDAFEVR